MDVEGNATRIEWQLFFCTALWSINARISQMWFGFQILACNVALIQVLGEFGCWDLHSLATFTQLHGLLVNLSFLVIPKGTLFSMFGMSLHVLQ